MSAGCPQSQRRPGRRSSCSPKLTPLLWRRCAEICGARHQMKSSGNACLVAAWPDECLLDLHGFTRVYKEVYRPAAGVVDSSASDGAGGQWPSRLRTQKSRLAGKRRNSRYCQRFSRVSPQPGRRVRYAARSGVLCPIECPVCLEHYPLRIASAVRQCSREPLTHCHEPQMGRSGISDLPAVN